MFLSLFSKGRKQSAAANLNLSSFPLTIEGDRFVFLAHASDNDYLLFEFNSICRAFPSLIKARRFGDCLMRSDDVELIDVDGIERLGFFLCSMSERERINSFVNSLNALYVLNKQGPKTGLRAVPGRQIITRALHQHCFGSCGGLLRTPSGLDMHMLITDRGTGAYSLNDALCALQATDEEISDIRSFILSCADLRSMPFVYAKDALPEAYVSLRQLCDLCCICGDRAESLRRWFEAAGAGTGGVAFTTLFETCRESRHDLPVFDRNRLSAPASESVYNFSRYGTSIRVVFSAAGSPLFCLADVCRNVCHVSPVTVRGHILASCPDKDMFSRTVCSADGYLTGNTFITEKQLYFVLFKTGVRAPKAVIDWIMYSLIPELKGSLRDFGKEINQGVSACLPQNEESWKRQGGHNCIKDKVVFSLV